MILHVPLSRDGSEFWRRCCPPDLQRLAVLESRAMRDDADPPVVRHERYRVTLPRLVRHSHRVGRAAKPVVDIDTAQRWDDAERCAGELHCKPEWVRQSSVLHPDAGGPAADWSILQAAKSLLDEHHGKGA